MSDDWDPEEIEGWIENLDPRISWVGTDWRTTGYLPAPSGLLVRIVRYRPRSNQEGRVELLPLVALLKQECVGRRVRLADGLEVYRLDPSESDRDRVIPAWIGVDAAVIGSTQNDYHRHDDVYSQWDIADVSVVPIRGRGDEC